MRNLILTVIAALAALPLFAQTITYADFTPAPIFNEKAQISIGLLMPTKVDSRVSNDALNTLRNRLEKVLTNNGVSSIGGELVMYPTIDILSSDLVEGGMQNFRKVKMEIGLTVVDAASGTMFAKEFINVSGSAPRDERAAIKNAITQLQPSNPKLNKFLDETKQKINSYYASNKQAIFNKAKSLASSGKYEEAIAMLANYPSQVEGAAEAQALLTTVYGQYINRNCAKILSEARAAYAVGDYVTAVILASEITPDALNYNDAQEFLTKIRKTVEKEDDDAKKQAMKVLEMSADIEKCKINAISKIASAQASQQVTNYNIIK